jgi:hypothetical protein
MAAIAIHVLQLSIVALLFYAIYKRSWAWPLFGIFVLLFSISFFEPKSQSVAISPPSTAAPDPTATATLTDSGIRQQSNSATASSSKAAPAKSTPPQSPPLKSRSVKYQFDETAKYERGELVALKTALKTIHWSRNSDPRSAAEEDYQSILDYSSTSQYHSFLEHLETEAEYNDYITGNEHANDDYLEAFHKAEAAEAKVKIGEELEAAGPPPQITSLFGVSDIVHDAIKALLKDPGSYKYLDVAGPWIATRGGKKCWLEKVHFSARNGFNGVVTGTASVWVNRPDNHDNVLDIQVSGN